MTWIDIVILLLLLIGLIQGLMRGIIVEATSIGAVIVGVIGARIWSADVTAWMLKQVTWSPEVCQVASYGLIFIGIVVALTIVAHFLTKLVKKIHLGAFNRICGGLFGIIKWSVIVLVIVWGFHKIDTRFHILKENIAQQSVIYPIMVEQSNYLANLFTDTNKNISHE